MDARVPGFSYDGRKKVARFVLYVPGDKGKVRRKKTLFGVTRDDALRLYGEFKDEVSRRSVDQVPRPLGRHLTFQEFVERYLDRIAGGLSTKTARNYGYTLEKHLIPVFGEVPLDRISSSAVQDFVADLKKREYSPSSIADYVRVLKVFLYQAVEREEIEAFPLRRRLKLEKIAERRLDVARFADERDHALSTSSHRRRG